MTAKEPIEGLGQFVGTFLLICALALAVIFSLRLIDERNLTRSLVEDLAIERIENEALRLKIRQISKQDKNDRKNLFKAAPGAGRKSF